MREVIFVAVCLHKWHNLINLTNSLLLSLLMTNKNEFEVSSISEDIKYGTIKIKLKLKIKIRNTNTFSQKRTFYDFSFLSYREYPH